MGDVRFERAYERIAGADDPVAAMRDLEDEEVIAALAAASRQGEPYLANVLATEAQNRVRRSSVITEYLAEGVYVLDDQGRVTFLNPAAERMLGWTSEALRGRDFHDVVHFQTEDGRPMPREDCAAVISLTRGVDYHRRDHGDAFTRRDGSVFPVEITSAPVKEDGLVIGAVAVFRDIEADRRAEEAERRLGAIVASSEDAITAETPDGVIMEWNPAAERLFGYTPKEAVGQSIALLIPEDRAEEELALTRRVGSGKERVRAYETVRVCKDGSRVPVSVSLSPLRTPGGRIVGVSAIYRSIRELKRAEEARRESEGRTRALMDVMDASAVGTIILDANFRVAWANRAAAEFFGVPREELVGVDKRRFVKERLKYMFERPDRFERKILSTYDENKHVAQMEVHVLPGAGREERWLEHWSQPIEEGPYAGGRMEHYTDQTGRKRAQAALEESESRHVHLFEAVPYATVVADLGRGVQAVNQALTELTGYTLEDLRGQTTRPLYADADEYAEVGAALLDHADRREPFERTVRWRHKNGEEFEVRIRASYVRDGEGRLTGFIGTMIPVDADGA